MFSIAELESEIVDATVYDLALNENVAQALEEAGILKVAQLVKCSAEDLRAIQGISGVALNVIRQRLSEIGEYLAGDPIPSSVLADPKKVLRREKSKGKRA